MNKAAITFDLDLTDYVSGGEVDEMESAFPLFQNLCKEFPNLRSTWFIRIDDQMQKKYGFADYVFRKHRSKLQWLTANGHELGWHFHSYTQNNGVWEQNTNDTLIVDELNRNYLLAKNHGLNLLRMGWTYHSNSTMEAINKFQLLADCSAMPRPKYSWDIAIRNWEGTPESPYFPSITDYRISGNANYSTLEYPLSMAVVEAVYDTEKNVKRYINPCYHPEIFKKTVDSMQGMDINLVSHPYEFLPASRPHQLLSFSGDALHSNLEYLQEIGYQFSTLGELIRNFILKNKNGNSR